MTIKANKSKVALKSIIFTVIAPGSVAILVPYVLLNSFGELLTVKIGNFRYLGLISMLLGSLIYFWCLWDFTFAGKGTPAPIDPPKELVDRGLYRFSRNPMYVGVLFILFGEAIFFATLLILGYMLVFFFCFHLFVIAYEEPTLRRIFGESYKRYCNAVPRWIPHRCFPRKRE
jgi:protein-S-isoprenylcysteine O-methyltransferase Ste14